jgi:hypothetical protein
MKGRQTSTQNSLHKRVQERGGPEGLSRNKKPKIMKQKLDTRLYLSTKIVR